MHHLLHVMLTALAVWWLWQVPRVFTESLVPGWFQATRLLHPFIILGISYLLTQDWRDAIIVAALTAFVSAFFERIGNTGVQEISFRRNRRSGLPPLP